MAKAKKEKQVEEENIKASTGEEYAEPLGVEKNIVEDDVFKQKEIDTPVYVPEIPIQIIEDNVTATVSAGFSLQVKTEPETDEILFLRKILKIQSEGCFGRHLDKLINDKIKDLKANVS